MVNEYEINGVLTHLRQMSGKLSSGGLSGNVNIAKIVDRTAIHYDTTEAWNSSPLFVAQEGHFYIYGDYSSREAGDGSVQLIPALKIGDGTSYLIDLPFVVIGDAQDIIDHINNWAVHVSENDRTNWDGKVQVDVDTENENLLISI